MPLNTTSPRTDVVFLKRRMRKGEVVAAPTPKKLSISLTGPVETVSTVIKRQYLTENIVLDAENPVARLSQYQSAIGSITVEGAIEFAWETGNHKGHETLTHEDPTIPAFGNRKIVQFHKSLVVIGARHFNQLRRVVIWSNGSDLVLKTHNNRTVTIKNPQGENVLYLSRIGKEIEVRWEKIENRNFAATFGL